MVRWWGSRAGSYRVRGVPQSGGVARGERGGDPHARGVRLQRGVAARPPAGDAVAGAAARALHVAHVERFAVLARLVRGRRDGVLLRGDDAPAAGAGVLDAHGGEAVERELFAAASV